MGLGRLHMTKKVGEMPVNEHADRLSADQTLKLWRNYQRTRDSKLRDRLVLTFAPMVKYIVYRKIREMPARWEGDDFISCGLEALIRSIDRFDPEKGATLEQFAWTRIHGAVLDELRRHDWAPRSLRRSERAINGARERFLAANDRQPTRAELAAALDMEPTALSQRIDDIALADVASLNKTVRSEDATTIERIDTIESVDEDTDPELTAQRREAKERFRSAFAKLPARERQVAVLLYVENRTLREIGARLGVSER